MSVSVREAAEADLPRLGELLAQLSLDAPREELGPPLPAVYGVVLREILADPHQTLLVAEADGRLVGTLSPIVVPNLSRRARPYAILENVVVDAGERGKGHGERLVAEAVDRARAAGCYKASLTSNVLREAAHRFYERLGFQPTHVGYRTDLY